MLGDVALRGPAVVNDFLNAGLLLAQKAEDLEPERVCHGLNTVGRNRDVLLAADQVVPHRVLQIPTPHTPPGESSDDDERRKNR